MRVLLFAFAFAEVRFFAPAMGPTTSLAAGVRGPVVSPVFYGKLPYPPLPGSESLLIGQKAKGTSVPSTSMTVGGIIVMLAVGATIIKRAAGGPSRGGVLSMKDPAVFIPDRDPPKGDAKWYMDQVKGAKCFFVTVTIPPEKELDFKEAIQADVRGSRLEEGCLLFDVMKGESGDGGCRGERPAS